jgi:hypothetical protein
MKFCSITVLLFVLSMLIITCGEQKEHSDEKPIVATQARDSALETIMKKFSLPYCADSMVDENSLIFFCSRTFDTSSLIVLKKNHERVDGVFYEILPTYHTYANDFADPKANVLFFEGYSFIVDSLIWDLVREQAQSILKGKDSLNRGPKYVDGKSFTLYHNFENCKGNSADEVVFERFDKFLKQSFLKKIIQSRKPIMRKIK